MTKDMTQPTTHVALSYFTLDGELVEHVAVDYDAPQAAEAAFAQLGARLNEWQSPGRTDEALDSRDNHVLAIAYTPLGPCVRLFVRDANFLVGAQS